MYDSGYPLLRKQPKSADSLSQPTAENVPCPVGQLVFYLQDSTDYWDTSNKLHPFATHTAFGSCRPLATQCQVVPVFSSSLLPAFTGRNFNTTTGSSATSHRFG